MAFTLTTAATATSALAGVAVGLAGLALPPVPLWIAGAVVALAAIADAHGSPRPVSTLRQIPQAWSVRYGPETVALLYGARLGVGPLTVLNTWLWWAMLAVGAMAGVAPAAIAGAVFGLVRGLVTTTAGMWLAPSAPARMGRLRTAEYSVAMACAVTAVLAGASVVARAALGAG